MNGNRGKSPNLSYAEIEEKHPRKHKARLVSSFPHPGWRGLSGRFIHLRAFIKQDPQTKCPYMSITLYSGQSVETLREWCNPSQRPWFRFAQFIAAFIARYTDAFSPKYILMIWDWPTTTELLDAFLQHRTFVSMPGIFIKAVYRITDIQNLRAFMLAYIDTSLSVDVAVKLLTDSGFKSESSYNEEFKMHFVRFLDNPSPSASASASASAASPTPQSCVTRGELTDLCSCG